MSTYPGQPPAAKKTLIWIAIACFVIGVVLTGFFVWRIVVTAPRTPQPIESGVVHLDKDGPDDLLVRAGARAAVQGAGLLGRRRAARSRRAGRRRSRSTATAGTSSPGRWTRSRRGTTASRAPTTRRPRRTPSGRGCPSVAFVLSIFGAIGSFLVFFVLGGDPAHHRPGQEPPPQPPGNTFPSSHQVPPATTRPATTRQGNYPRPTAPHPATPPGSPPGYPPGHPPGNIPPNNRRTSRRTPAVQPGPEPGPPAGSV